MDVRARGLDRNARAAGALVKPSVELRELEAGVQRLLPGRVKFYWP
jgi:hypothetical protein